ncbi:hypothetical protein EKK58_03055 [Candidatus Dependentiae bacterium]|nr:MAG: hypothetical protein EKK58_03055 [Candidatus Dependentiae bacterium]
MIGIKKLFLLMQVIGTCSLLSMEKASSKITIFDLPADVFNYIVDWCLKPKKALKKHLFHTILEYMFYKRITPANKEQWHKEKQIFLQEYAKICYIKNVYSVYYALRLVSRQMHLKTNNYFCGIVNHRPFLFIKSSIYVVYLSNVLSSLKYRPYHNKLQHDDRSRMLYLISVMTLKRKDLHLNVSINMDTRQLLIDAVIKRYFTFNNIKDQLVFMCNKKMFPTKKIRITFPTPTEFFDNDKQSLSKNFYQKFFNPKDAVYIENCIDSLVIGSTYTYHQNPPCIVQTTYNNVKTLKDVDLTFHISYQLNEDLALTKQLLY